MAYVVADHGELRGDQVSEVFAFDEFELDVARFELRRSGQSVEIQPKVLRLLQYLIVHRERAVQADELLRELWPETTVGAGSLRRAVLGARLALGDRTESNPVIRTVRGLGYQFARSVTPLGVRELPPSQTVPWEPAAEGGMHAGMPFVGRAAVLASLTMLLHEALQARGGCVLLSGSPGIGKTRTAEELCTRARSLGAETWLGRCTDLDGAPAFWPFIQVLRDALRDRGADELRKLMGQEIAEIAQAMPDLARIWPDLPSATSLSTPSERFRLFEGVAMFLRRAAERRPIVLSFDDLHRADSATLQLLAFVVRQLDSAAILIVGTLRQDLGAALAPDSSLSALARAERTRCIELSGFDRETVRDYLATAAGAEPPEFAVELLQERTAGNALFVRQLVERWRATDMALDWETLAGAAHSLDLHGAIQRHLEVVPESGRELLRAASVLGREFSSAVLARVVDASIESIWLQLSQAVATRLIEPCADHGRFRFTHSLIRDALYRQLPLDTRARLHACAGHALESQGIGRNYLLLAEVARHFVCAAPTHDAGRALQYTLQIAESALARLAYEEAAAHYQRALQLREYAEPDPLARMTLLFKIGAALARTRERAASRAALYEAFGLAREHGVVEMLFQAATLIATHPETGMVDRDQVAALREALRALSKDDERCVLLQAALAKSLVYASDPEERVGLALDSLQRGRAIDEIRLRAEVLHRCHEALIDPEHLAQRVAIAEELLQLAHHSDDPAAQLRASQTQIETSLERGDMAGFESAIANMETLAERIREPFFRWHAKAARGTQALIFGRPAEAERRAHEALAFGAPFGEKIARHVHCTLVVAIFLLQARTADAEPLAREMALRHPGVRGWSARVAAIDGMLGRLERARRCLTEIMARGLAWVRQEPFALSGLCSVADLCAIVPDVDAAKDLYRAMLPYADHVGITHLAAATHGPIARHLGILAELQGDVVLAEQHYRRALEDSAALRSPTYLALTGAGYAQLLLQVGGATRRADAVHLVQVTLKHAERSELHAVTEFMSALARRHGVRPSATDRWSVGPKAGSA